MNKLMLIVAVAVLTGCSAKGPVLYPNAHLQSVGEARAQQDVAECEELADRYVKSPEGLAAAKSTAVGGAGGPWSVVRRAR
jgi:hypothetical protein